MWHQPEPSCRAVANIESRRVLAAGMLRHVDIRASKCSQLVGNREARFGMPNTRLPGNESSIGCEHVDFAADNLQSVVVCKAESCCNAPRKELRNGRPARNDVRLRSCETEQAGLRSEISIHRRLQRKRVGRRPSFVTVSVVWGNVRAA